MHDIQQTSSSTSFFVGSSLQPESYQVLRAPSCGPQITIDEMTRAVQVLKCTLKNATGLAQAPTASDCADEFGALIRQGIESLNKILFEGSEPCDDNGSHTQSYTGEHNYYPEQQVQIPITSRGTKRKRDLGGDELTSHDDSDSDPDSRPSKILRLTEETEAYHEEQEETPSAVPNPSNYDDEIEAFFNFCAAPVDPSETETATASGSGLESPFMTEKALGKRRALDNDDDEFDASTATLVESSDDALSQEDVFRYLKYVLVSTSDSTTYSTDDGSTSDSANYLTDNGSTSDPTYYLTDNSSTSDSTSYWTSELISAPSAGPNLDNREMARHLRQYRASVPKVLRYLPFTPSGLRNCISWSEIQVSS